MPQIPVRKAYKIRSPQTWDLIRAAYVNGETAASLTARFDVTEWAIRNRARKEGWTKRAYAAASEQNLSADRAAAAAPKAARPSAPAPDEALIGAVLDEVADGEQVAALALGAAARCIAFGRFVEAERLGKLAETLSRLTGGAAGGSASSAGAWRSEGAAHHRGADAADEPKFTNDEPFMSPGETKRSPYQVEMLRADVERRYERLAARFERPPSIIGSDAALDPYPLDPDDINEGDAP